MAQFVSKDRGDEFMKQADKKQKNASGFICTAFGQSQITKEEAAELYSKAAAQYKISKCYEKAGIAYSKAAECQMSAENMLEAKQSWRECGKCYQHIDHNKAMEAYQNAIEIDLDSDRMRQAARLQQEIGKMLADQMLFQEAIISYEKAAEYFEMEHDVTGQNKMLLMVAQLAGTQQNWQKAAKIFEDIAKDWMENNLLRWQVKEQLFKAALLRICLICDDDTLKNGSKWNEMEIVQEEYNDLSDIYRTSRECKLISNVIQCLRQNDIEGFKNALNDYDRICKMDKWKMDLLHYILGCMKNMEQDKIMSYIEEDIFGVDNDENMNDDNDVDQDNIKKEQEQPNPFENPLNKKDLENAPCLEMDT